MQKSLHISVHTASNRSVDGSFESSCHGLHDSSFFPEDFVCQGPQEGLDPKQRNFQLASPGIPLRENPINPTIKLLLALLST